MENTPSQNQAISLRIATPDDLEAILHLFEKTVHAIAAKDYNEAQRKAWTASVHQPEKWLNRIKTQYFILAISEEKLVGMASLEDGHYIDIMYVHKDFQGRGIAQLLLETVEEQARHQGHVSLSSDVSITARPFFEKHGYVVKHRNRIFREGVELNNFRMRKE